MAFKVTTPLYVPFVNQITGYDIKPSDIAIRITGAVASAVYLPIQGTVTIDGTKSGLFTIGETVTGSVSGATGIVLSQGTGYIVVQMTSSTQFGTTDTVTGGTSGKTVTAITGIAGSGLVAGQTIKVGQKLSGGNALTITALGGPTIGNSTGDTSEVISAYGGVSTFEWDGSMWWVVDR